MKPCKKFEERISEMLFGEVPEEECQKLHMHMSGCEGCMSFYLSLYETLETGENEDFYLTEEQKSEIFKEAVKLDEPVKKMNQLWSVGISVAASITLCGLIILSDSNLLNQPKAAVEGYKYEKAQDALEEAAKEPSPPPPAKKLYKSSADRSIRNKISEKQKSVLEPLNPEVPNEAKFMEEEKLESDLTKPNITTIKLEDIETNEIALEYSNRDEPSTYFVPNVMGGRKAVEKKSVPRKEEELNLVLGLADKDSDGIGRKDEKINNDLVGGMGDVAGGENELVGGISEVGTKTYRFEDDPFAEADPFAIEEPEFGKRQIADKKNSPDALDELTVETLAYDSGEQLKNGRGLEQGAQTIKGNKLRVEGAIRQNFELEADHLFYEALELKKNSDPENARKKVELAIQRLSQVNQDKRILKKKEKYQEFYGSLVQVEESKRPMLSTQAQPMSTFSIDVDTASYQIALQTINSGGRMNPLSVRAEEFINYFNYKYEAPKAKAFKVHSEVAVSPFHRGSKIMKIGVQGKRPGGNHRAASHFCFIVDTSGSMADENRLPMVKKVLPMIIKQMSPGDKVSLVSCGLKSRLELDFVDVQNADLVAERIQGLNAVGATNLEASLLDGYRQVQKYIQKGIYSRVVLFSDGVANLGEKNAENILQNLQYAKNQGAGITVIGMGEKEYNDNFLETLADKGDGNYVYIGNNKEAQKTFEEKFAATFHTIAYNVKIQVEFDPSQVSKYRLLGYENRRLKNKDFRNDKVDAGEVGSGQSVTAIYEVEMTGRPSSKPMAEVRLRYRDAVDNEMKEFSTPVLQKSYNTSFENSSPATRLAFISGKFAEVLKDGGNSEGITVDKLLTYLRPLASQMNDADVNELLNLIEKSR
ncbi:MAG: von Willebrand factor type A domain-containing protein [Lentisphaeraceae bacterium]|nr:von Willebrand factor type A domain-containing protein [Lentisphaeraceae bacterium]